MNLWDDVPLVEIKSEKKRNPQAGDVYEDSDGGKCLIVKNNKTLYWLDLDYYRMEIGSSLNDCPLSKTDKYLGEFWEVFKEI